LKGPTGGVFSRLKIVFRYDLTPILSRLDDSVKRVPIPGPGRTGVLFADAPRLYRVPMALTVLTQAGLEKREAEIVLSRRGIARIVATGGPAPALPTDAELPELDDNGAGALAPQS